ncbi:hypothetical protein K438DRAFT_1577823 [Mycena galopus ATCC 62051]|nr:hypothetical protein K438DRAFT_1577823 [Mycena galopus ATCC 62051]
MLYPLATVQELIPSPVSRSNYSPVSFNNWNNIGSLDGFDNFYGEFSHFRSPPFPDRGRQQEVCHSVDITIIQQRLAVLQEIAKKIITEQICEVETQTITFEQYYQSLGHFHNDLRRHSSYQVGYDRGIVGHFGQIYGSDGSFCTDDWGFSGQDIGSQTVVISNSNWNAQTSPNSVDSAYYAVLGASVY